jgi:hypothetical protein
MSDKELQAVTECVSYIGQPSLRRPLPGRRLHITLKVRIAVCATSFPPLMSLTFQYRAHTLQKVGDRIAWANLMRAAGISKRLTAWPRT